MENDQEPRTTDQGPRTKRRYTVSDKVRAANRLNLEKACAVDKKIRYRRTAKRLEASRASLLKARQSPNYKPFVRHGLRAVDLRQSAPQVGETQEEYDRHVQAVEKVLPANRQRLRNAVRGLAQALWRRRRVFVSRAHREALTFYLELEKVGVWGLCPASVQDLGGITTDVLGEGEHPRLEEIMDCLDKRLVRVAEAYLSEHAEDLVKLGVWGNHPYRADFVDQPPEVIGNGLLPRGQVKRRMKKDRKGNLKPTGLWLWILKVARTKSGLLKEWLRLGNRLPDPRRDEDFALHLRLIEAAFFGDRHAGFGLEPSKLENGNWKIETGHSEDFPVSNFQFPVSPLDLKVAKFKAAHPKLYQAVWNLAEATWQRLQVFARQAEKEAQDLREKLEQAAKGTLGPGQKSLKELWREAHDRRLDQLPRNPIDQALWAGFQVALEKAKAEKQESEARSQEPEEGTGDKLQGTGAASEAAESKMQNARSQTEEPRSSDQSSIDNRQSSIPKQSSIDNHPEKQKSEARSQESEAAGSAGSGQSSIDNPPSPVLDGLRLQWRVERLIGVFLCSEASPAFQAAQQGNRRVEGAFRALEGALEAALPPLVGKDRQTVGPRP